MLRASSSSALDSFKEARPHRKEKRKREERERGGALDATFFIGVHSINLLIGSGTDQIRILILTSEFLRYLTLKKKKLQMGITIVHLPIARSSGLIGPQDSAEEVSIFFKLNQTPVVEVASLLEIRIVKTLEW